MLTEVSYDNGKTWQPLGVVRTAPGGPSQGQSDKSSAGKVTVAAAGLTVDLFTVAASKTGYVTDLFVQLGAATTADVSLVVGGQVVWTAQASQTPMIVWSGWPFPAAAGQVVQLLIGAPGAGTPALYYRVGAWEQ